MVQPISMHTVKGMLAAAKNNYIPNQLPLSPAHRLLVDEQTDQ